MGLKKVKIFSLILIYLSFLSIPALCNVHYRMEITDDEIGIGQESTIQIYGWAQGAASGNGIVSWQLDLMLDALEDGIVTITNEVIEEPYPGFFFSKGSLFLNDPYDGAARAEGAFGIQATSDLGIGDGQLANYDLLASITVTGVSEGTVTYELGSYSTPLEDNFFATLADDTKLTGLFEDTVSQVSITVVPEPGTLLMLSLISSAGLRRKQRS
jgi:hypothetical protein